jgi:putative peptidoglycan lipid II flippase
MSQPRTADFVRSPWGVGPTIILLAVFAKGLAFLREPFIAAVFGASASSDAYYISVGLPLLAYNVIALPLSQWVTARLAPGRIAGERAHAFYSRALVSGGGGATVLALLVVVVCRPLIQVYAPGLQGPRLDEAVGLTRIGALALPALVLQALAAGRLYAMRRFVVVYIWLALGGLVGLVGVMALTRAYGPTGAVLSFVIAWWTPALALVPLAAGLRNQRDPIAAGDIPEVNSAMIWRAVAVQVFFQGNALLVYGFASRLEVGQIASTLFAGKIIMAVYETVVLTAGILIFPRVAELLHGRDDAAAGDAVQRALDWVVPITVGLMVLLVAARTELVALVYRRRAFDDAAVHQVSSALLGYAPYIVGITLVEMLHRVMALRGRVLGYLTVFGIALGINWVASYAAVERFGLLGVSLGASIGVLSAGIGLWTYAHRRVPALRSGPIVLLIARAMVAAAVSLSLVVPLHAMIEPPASYLGQVLLIGAIAVVVGALFVATLRVLGHRWRWSPGLRTQGASG